MPVWLAVAAAAGWCWPAADTVRILFTAAACRLAVNPAQIPRSGVMRNPAPKALVHEPLVSLGELGYGNLGRVEAEAFGEVFGVTIRWDYLDRAAVSLDDAYTLGERRRQLEAEFHAEQARRGQAAQQARVDLEADLAAVFQAAYDAALEAVPPGIAPDGHAAVAGLQAAKLRWLAAPADIRRQVPTVEVEHEDGSVSSYDLGMVVPRGTVAEGIAYAVQKANATVRLTPREADALVWAATE